MLEIHCPLSHPLLHCGLLLVTPRWPHSPLRREVSLWGEMVWAAHAQDWVCLCVPILTGFKVNYSGKVRPRYINYVPVAMWEGFLYTRSAFKHIPVSCLWGTQENFHCQILSHRSRETILKKQQKSSETHKKGGGGPFLCWSLLVFFPCLLNTVVSWGVSVF